VLGNDPNGSSSGPISDADDRFARNRLTDPALWGGAYSVVGNPVSKQNPRI
jgi:hypothetical protein